MLINIIVWYYVLVATGQYINIHHPYITCEFLVIEVDGSSKQYLDWITQSTSHK